MIKECYVNFETARLLKDKGFNEYCFAAYSKNIEDFITAGPIKNSDIKENDDRFFVTAPTQQMAMAWLREVHNIFIQVELYSKHNDYCFELFQNTHRLMVEKREVYNSYESACESAINYCLTNLI